MLFFMLKYSCLILGCRQVVRHRTLTPASAGSSPAIPATNEAAFGRLFSFVAGMVTRLEPVAVGEPVRDLAEEQHPLARCWRGMVRRFRLRKSEASRQESHPIGWLFSFVAGMVARLEPVAVGEPVRNRAAERRPLARRRQGATCRFRFAKVGSQPFGEATLSGGFFRSWPGWLLGTPRSQKFTVFSFSPCFFVHTMIE